MTFLIMMPQPSRKELGHTTDVINTVAGMPQGKLPSVYGTTRNKLAAILNVGDGVRLLAAGKDRGKEDWYVSKQLSLLMGGYFGLVDAMVSKHPDVCGEGVMELQRFVHQQLHRLRRHLSLLDAGYAELERRSGDDGAGSKIAGVMVTHNGISLSVPPSGQSEQEGNSIVALRVNEVRKKFLVSLSQVLGVVREAVLADEAHGEVVMKGVGGMLVESITKHGGDFNDPLLVHAFQKLRGSTVQDWFEGYKRLLVYTMNVLYAETEVSNDEVVTTKRPFFEQPLDDNPMPGRFAKSSDFERFLYTRRDHEGNVEDLYVQKKGVYVSEKGRIYEYCIIYEYPQSMWQTDPGFVSRPTPPGSDVIYYITCYDTSGKILNAQDPDRPVRKSVAFGTHREEIEDIVIANCRSWDDDLV